MLSEDVDPQVQPSSPRKKRCHRRAPPLRLSSDTTTTTTSLPAYTRTNPAESDATWEVSQVPEDSPPDYPHSSQNSSADEADEETELTGSDGDDIDDFPYQRGRQGSFTAAGKSQTAPQSATTSPRRTLLTRVPPQTASPRHLKRFSQQQSSRFDDFGDPKGTHKRRHSSVSVLRAQSLRQPHHKHSASLSAAPQRSRLNPKSDHERDTDSYLDSLLERSVHALEISNTLLQSSMSTQASVSALFSGSSTSLGIFKSSTTPPPDQYTPTASRGSTLVRGYSGYHDVDSALEARAIGLSSKLMRNWDMQETWAQELERIKDDVDSLFNGGGGDRRSNGGQTSRSRQSSWESQNPPIAHSLPGHSPLSSLRISSTSSSPRTSRRRLSVDHFRGLDDEEGDTHRSLESTGLETSEQNQSRSRRKLTEDEVSSPAQSQLRLAPQGRSNLVSPPPRALTMYIEATSFPSSPNLQPGFQSEKGHAAFVLPSTLGVRSASASTSNLHLPGTVTSPGGALPPQVTETVHDPSTPAYNMLSSLVARGVPSASGSTTSLLQVPTPSSRQPMPQRRRSSDVVTESAPSSFVSSFIHRAAAGMRRRSSSPGDTPTRHRSSSVDRPLSHSPRRSPRQHTTHVAIPSFGAESTQSLPVPSHPPFIRRMTPPTEEESQNEGDGSVSSSDSCLAKMTIVSLRKILDEQAPPKEKSPSGPAEDDSTTLSVPRGRVFEGSSGTPSSMGSMSRSTSSTGQGSINQLPRRAPAFFPRTPGRVPSAGTSTATASISRLFTKGVHSSSTRPRSPPLRSVMKGKAPRVDVTPGTDSDGNSKAPSLAAASLSSNSPAPSPSPSFAHFPEFVSRALANGNKSASSSGRSTPKRISFAELPESYASTKPEGESGGLYAKRRSGAKRVARRRSGNGSESSGLNVRRPETPPEDKSWWSSWLTQRNAYDEREGRLYHEDRPGRAWAGRMGMGFGAGGMSGMGHSGLDDWGV